MDNSLENTEGTGAIESTQGAIEDSVSIDAGSDANDLQSATLVNDVCNIATAAGIEGVVAPVVVDRPEAGDSFSLLIEPGKEYFLDFEETEVASMVQNGDDLTITLKDGSSILLTNFISATNNEDLPAKAAFRDPFALSDFADMVEVVETVPSEDDLEEPQAEIREAEEVASVETNDEPSDDVSVANIEPAAGNEQTAQQLAQIEPAAGDDGAGGTRGGFGYQSSFSPQGIIGLEDVGPIDPTLLNYGVEFRNDILFVQNQPPSDDNPIIPSPGALVLDETNLNGGSQSLNGTINVDFGADAAGATIAPNDSFNAGGSLPGGTDLQSNGDDIVVTLNAAGDGYVGTTTGGIVVFDIVIDSETGDYTFTQYEQIDHADGTDPNDAITLNFGVVATDGDGDQATTSVQVTILDDAPVLEDSNAGTIDEAGLGPTTVSGDLVEDSGEDTPAEISTTDAFDATGGTVGGGPLTSGGEPVTVTETANGYIGTIPDGVGGTITVFELEITDTTTGAYDFTLYKGLDHDAANDIINLEFGVQITDYDGDSDPATITVSVKDSVPEIPENEVPVVGQGYEVLDETNIGPESASGTISFNVGGDTPGTFEGTGNFTLPTGLTSGGQPVEVTFDSATGTYTGTAGVGGTTIFTLVVEPNGDYTFNLLGPVDHPDATDANDDVRLTFEVQVTDADGDSDTGSIIIDLLDDGPTVQDDVIATPIKEADLGPVTVNGDLNEDFGADGEGEITTNDTFSATGQTTTATLSSGGEPVTVTETANGYEGTIPDGLGGTITVFTLEITDASTGEYTFTLNQPLDHDGDADNDPTNDIINLNFGVQIDDFDGDTDTATITVQVQDDKPTIPGGDDPKVGEGREIVDETNLGDAAATQSGTVAFDFGDDGAGQFGFDAGVVNLNGLTSQGTPVVATFDPVTNTYTGTANGNDIFTLELNNETGEYEFTLLDQVDHPDAADPNDDVQITFGVQITDADGSQDTGSIVIDILDDAPIANDDSVTFDADDVTATGNVITNDDLSNDEFATGAENKVTEITNGTDTLSVPEGGSVTIDGQYGELEIFSDGTYEYTLTDASALNGGSANFDPVAADVAGIQDSITLDGITVTSAGTGDFDLSWVDTADGSGIGLDNLNTGDSPKIWPSNESLDISAGSPVQTMTITIAELGDNNDNGDKGADLIITLADGSQVTAEIQFDPAGINNGEFTFTLDAADYGQPIASVNLASTNDGQYGASSMLLNEVSVTYPGEECLEEEFEYTLIDSDGDTDTAVLEIKIKDDNDTVPTISVENLIVDETDINDTDSDVITADFGEDTPGEYSADGTYDLFGLTSNGEAINVDFDATTNTYTGTANGNTIFTFTVNADGTYDFVLTGAVDHPIAGDNSAGEHNDAVEIEFGVQVTDSDGDVAKADVKVTVLDDGPDAVNDTATVNDIDIPVTGNVTDNDDSGADVDATVTNVSYDGTDYPVSEGAPTVITTTYGELTINSDGSFSYQANGTNTVFLNEFFEYTYTDADGDTDTATLKLQICDVNVRPEIATEDLITDETDIDDTGDTDSGQITADFGQGNTGTFAGDGTFDLNGLTSEGQPIDVTYDAASQTYTGVSHGEDIFTFVVESDGDYTFTLLGAVDHPIAGDDSAGEHNDAVEISFGVIATSSNGTTQNGDVDVTILDDGPYVQTSQFTAVDETNLSDTTPLVVNRTLNHDYGEDGPGEIRPVTDGFSALYQVGGAEQTLTSNGVEIVVSDTANGYVGVAGGETIFTLVVNDDGSYTYTQEGSIDHPDASNPDDVIWLKFEVEIVDGDGDTDIGIIGIDVHDDGPVAHDDTDTFAVSDGGSEGDVLPNDELSTDQPNSVTQISFAGNTVDIPANGSNVIDGDFGQLEINSDGSYEYTLFDGNSGIQTVYTYNIDNPPGSDAGGDIKNVETSFNVDSEDFTFSMTVEDISEGFTVALSPGDNPKGHGGELALIYFDASGTDPVVTAYNYNGANAQNSWYDGSAEAGVQNADPIVSSLTSPDIFDNIEVIDNGDGTVTFSFNMDGSVIQNFDPAYGPDGEWTGIEFGDYIGVWLHPVTGLETDYNQDGFLTQWDVDAQGWYDTFCRPTHAEQIGGEDTYDEFVYTLTDADGDSSIAVLTLDGEASKIVEGTTGNDLLAGGEDNDVLFGNGGNDVFLFESISQGVDVIADFSAGDVIDLSSVLQGYDALQDDINDFVFATEANDNTGATNTIISVDVDGSAGPATATDLVVIQGASGLDIETITNDGQAVIV